MEDDFPDVVDESIVVTEMRYGVGARGIDFLGRSHDGGAETKGFPVYDGHGNMIATLARSESSPYFGIADQRSYDVWGSLRYSQSSGDPRQRYCANLGHVQDDESGFIYMRARYYEPSTGRFVSEDPARDSINWFSYCLNDPINETDPRGLMRGRLKIDWAINIAKAYNAGDFDTVILILEVTTGVEIPEEAKTLFSSLPTKGKIKSSLGSVAKQMGRLDEVTDHIKKLATASEDELRRLGKKWLNDIETIWTDWLHSLKLG